MTFRSLHNHGNRLKTAGLLVATALSLLATSMVGRAGNLTRGSISNAPGAGAASGSQTSTPATTSTAQATQAAIVAMRAQVSMQRSVMALHALQAQQNSQVINMSNSGANVVNGLAAGGLVPRGGLTAATAPAIDNVQLNSQGSSLTVTNGGTIVLPGGTTGADQIAITGNGGSIVTSSGTITVKSGTVTTTTGGSLTTTSGLGTITTGASGDTITTSSAVTITSTTGGTVTAPGGTATTFAANSTIVVPPGSTIALTGAGTVTTTGASTLTLTGAGSLAGGTVVTGAGTTNFTGDAIASLPSGSRVNLTGNDTLSLADNAGGALSLILPASTSFSMAGGTTSSPTTSYNVPGSWTGVGSLSQSVATTPTGTPSDYVVTIQQNTPQAFLDWDSFNVGKSTTLDFDQSLGGANVGQWVAINEIPANMAPSQIFGMIQAPGQVYVINQNGILFGGSSQVNVHGLVASSLPINMNLVNQGLLTGAATDDQFLFSQLTINALSGVTNPTPSFVPPAAPTGGDGDVIVQPGAVLSSPTTEEHAGGRIALVGPVVENEGTISTPDGQTILAAGLQVGFEAHSQNDPSLRGLDVYVGKVTDPGYNGGATTDISGNFSLGSAINTGTIDIDRADVTMTGAEVEQNGVINGSTSVTLNGRVDLLADYDAQVINNNGTIASVSPTATGTVKFGADSLTQILPELSSTDTVVGASLALPSMVNVQGGSIYMGTDALLLAPGADVPPTNANSTLNHPALDLTGTQLTSGVTFNAGDWVFSGDTFYNFYNNTGQVYLDSGAVIDVSGSTNVSASVDENIVAVQLRGTELANSPLQQNGALRGQTIDVDIRQTGVYDGQAWIGTPLADASGYVGLIQHDVGELTVNGGTVAINAGNSVVMKKGSDIDVSGGYINYQGGNVQTTQVVSNGLIYDISKATPDKVYSGIYTGFTTTSTKWGITQSYANSIQTGEHYEAGYLQGGNGGSLSITAPTMVLDGQLAGTTLTGAQQRTPVSQIVAEFANATFPGTNFVAELLPILGAPKASTLSLTFSQNQNSADPFILPTVSPNVTFQTQAFLDQNPQAAAGPFGTTLSTDRQSMVYLSQDLINSDGFENFNLDTSASGTITVPTGVNLVAAPSGAISFRGANIDLEANITSPGGSLSFTAYEADPFAPVSVTPPDFTRGNFTLGAGVTLNTNGLIVDDRSSSPTADTLPLVIAGGSVTINSFNADLISGSTITTSGGASINNAGTLTYGNGGTISIKAGTDPGGLPILGGNLTLGASYLSGESLQSYSGAAGGSLTLQAPLIQVGGTLPATPPSINIGSTPNSNETVAADTLLLSPEFFNEGGFTNFTLTGLGAESAPNGVPDGNYLPAVVIAANTKIQPIVEGYLPVYTNGAISLVPMTQQQASQMLPSQRSPVSLTFNTLALPVPDLGFASANRLRAGVVMEAGSVIQLDPSAKGSVTLAGDTVEVAGDIFVPGGNISVSGKSPGGIYLEAGEATVDLTSTSILSTQGQTLLTQNNLGYRTGSVLNGGTISISGNIVAEDGAQLDVSGWRDDVDVAPGSVGSFVNNLSAPVMVRTTEDSNAGTITLSGKEELFNDATLIGIAGGSTSSTTAAGLAVGGSKAQGGSLLVSSGTVSSTAGSATPADPTLFVSESSSDLPGLSPSVIGGMLVGSNGFDLTNGGGYLAVDSFNEGGFGTITLSGVVQFSGSVDITASKSLSVASGGFIYGVDDAGGHPAIITLTAPYIALGTAFAAPKDVQQDQQQGSVYSFGSEPFYLPPVGGDGVLVVNASTLADVGNLSLQGIGTLDFNGFSTPSGFVGLDVAGDIRGDGTLDVAGTINLNARQIYPPTETTFTIAAYDSNGVAGSVNIYVPEDEALPSVPLSAGGTLNIYASVINQSGVLRAPSGTINLGWDGTGTAPVDLVTNTSVNATQTLTLSSGSRTSVSSQGAVIPYGYIDASGDWFDPAGNDISAGGTATLPGKLIHISAVNVNTDSGAVIDISGGGDLYANEFVPGVGGTNNILGSNTGFAVIPGYSADYAYAPYDAVLASMSSGAGYATSAYSNLAVGDQVYLNASNGLAAGTYTLLPAGYALLPGASLVTPQTGVPNAFTTNPDGASVVSGVRSSGLNGTNEQSLDSAFEVAPQAVVNARAEYDGSFADTYFPASAAANSVSVPRLPEDAGQLVLIASQSLTLPNTAGTLVSQADDGGLGGEVDIASSTAINIYNAQNPSTFITGDLNLDAASLDAFGADSLLIGGFRQTGANGTSVTVLTDDLTVNNAGEALTGSDLILVANQTLTVASGANINAGTEVPGATVPVAQALSLTGNGTLLRVSSDPSAQIVRSGVNATIGTDPADLATDPAQLIIGAGATIAGATVPGATTASAGSVILDSTNLTSLDPTATLSANTLTINSGMVSIELDTPAPIAPPPGLVLSGLSLSTLQQAAQNLSILSYTTFDIWGAGEIGDPAVAGKFAVQNLDLHAAQFRGFDNGGGTVTINAQNVELGGVTGGVFAPSAAPSAGSLVINAGTVNLDANAFQINQYSQVTLTASKEILLGNGTGGLSASNDLTLSSPLITAAPLVPLTPLQEQAGVAAPTATKQTITAGGALLITTPGGVVTSDTGGLGADLTLEGASVTVDGSISLPSGSLTLHATTGDVTIASGGEIATRGTAQDIFNLTQYTNGGQITLTSDEGNVILESGATVNVAANSGGGNAGSLSVNAATGTFTFSAGSMLGQGGTGGQSGTFAADIGSLSSLDSLNSALDADGFTQSISIRDRTDSQVTLNGVVQAGTYNLSADRGSITVNGKIDASNTATGGTGGVIDLAAWGDVTLAANSILTVEGATFDHAGKGGSITLDAGAEETVNGVATAGPGSVDLAAGSTIDLRVMANDNSDGTINGTATTTNAMLGEFSGTLLIEAPQIAGNTDLQVDPIQGQIEGASSIVLAGNQLFDLSGTGGAITNTGTTQAAGGVLGSGVNVEASVMANGTLFAGNTSAILTRLFGAGGNPYGNVLQVEPGAEIVNDNLDSAAHPTAGDLTLASTWDLSSYRFGPNNVPGYLTLRAGGNLVLNVGASLSDGFMINPAMPAADGQWTATLMSTPSWSYRLVAGADFSAADFNQVLPEDQLESVDASGNPVLNSQGDPIYNGSLLLGKGATALPTTQSTLSIMQRFFQTIRTGTGSIDIDAGGDVQLLNNVATIYTAGDAVADPTLGGTFQVPTIRQSSTTLGSYNPVYAVQYSQGGGDLTISAQDNIGHYMANGAPDSSLEMPTNWLFRQGAVNSSGLFTTTTGVVQSTSWWVDFNNFFEGVGALGGGNVTLTAGNNIDNIDAVLPTNARMPGLSNGSAIAPNASSLVEFGGGDLIVSAGNDINGGVYYVERGQGALSAGDDIVTNSTRAAILPFGDTDPQNDLPTTLFLGGSDGGNGSASFTVNAGGNLLLGPVANPFLLPQSINNSFQEKTYFSTYASKDSVDVTSLTGTVTLADKSDSGQGSLSAWYTNILESTTNSGTVAATSYKWLGIIENPLGVADFSVVSGLMAPTLQVTSFAGDINIRGSVTLSPSPTGTLNLAAAGSVNGFQANASDGDGILEWGSSMINLSDADPNAIPGITSPSAPASTANFSSNTSTGPLLNSIDALFAESGATQGVSLQTQTTLHAPGPLHADDPTGPVHIYAEDGNISGINLFSGKETDVIAGNDITDIALYLQNTGSDDISVVQAGRDITAYDVSSPLRLQGQTGNNLLVGQLSDPEGTDVGAPNAGDIQIAGPGTLEVLAGRNLNLGTGPSNSDGTALGIVSIGKEVNPFLPFGGADIFAAAGLGAGTGGLEGSALNFGNVGLVDGVIKANDPSTFNTTFIGQFLNPDAPESARYLPDLGALMGLPANATSQQIWMTFGQLSAAHQDTLALNVFYLVLRDAGRDHNDATSPNAGTYTEGDAAVAALFPGTAWKGDVSLTAREIKTDEGGNIDVLAPGGSVAVGFNVPGSQPIDQGILTVDGGNISLFVNNNIDVGTSRIFTLHGGNVIAWASIGNVDAGASSKTVQSAPPTTVLIDPTSGDVETDLAGLATGGGIGVLETVAGAPPGDVDLIAPKGTVDAGDAGIRASGNVTIAATQVLNAGNITVGGKSSGVPTGTSAPSLGALAAGNSSAGAANSAASEVAQQGRGGALPEQIQMPSIITVEVLGYGGGDD